MLVLIYYIVPIGPFDGKAAAVKLELDFASLKFKLQGLDFASSQGLLGIDSASSHPSLPH